MIKDFKRYECDNCVHTEDADSQSDYKKNVERRFDIDIKGCNIIGHLCQDCFDKHLGKLIESVEFRRLKK